MEVSNQYVDEAAKGILDSRAKKRFINAVTKVGRPTEYCEKLCTDFLAHRAIGKTIEQSLLEVGISDTTYYRWLQEKPEFRGVAKKGKYLAKAFWDEMAEDNVDNRSFNFLLFESQYKRRHNCSESAPVDCPGFSEENSDVVNIQAIFKSIANKQVSPDDAAKLMSLIKTKQEVTVMQEILPRLDQLEHQVKNN